MVNVKQMDTGVSAQGDGITDDTAAIQRAIDLVGGRVNGVVRGGTVLIPDGTYRINAVTRLKMRSQVTLRLSANARLQALPNGLVQETAVVDFTRVNTASIIGGTVIGERDAHTSDAGEHGMGIMVRASQNIYIDGVTAINAWGDGAYVGGGSKTVHFCNFTADHNRRQGLSITHADNVIVEHSVFKNTGGYPPAAGIDIEPNQNEVVNDVTIRDSQFTANQGYGVQMAMPRWATAQSRISKIRIHNNVISGNTAGGVGVIYTRQQDAGSDIKVKNNQILDNGTTAVILTPLTAGNEVTENTIRGGAIVDRGQGNITAPNTLAP